MVWQQIVLIVWLAIGTIANILLIGKERDPISPGVAVANLILAVCAIALVVSI
jgi:hypothetical protein